jgi:hypothetical protein
MRTNSGSGESKNNNHDPTLRDRNPQQEMKQAAERGSGTAPSDSREPRK